MGDPRHGLLELLRHRLSLEPLVTVLVPADPRWRSWPVCVEILNWELGIARLERVSCGSAHAVRIDGLAGAHRGERSIRAEHSRNHHRGAHARECAYYNHCDVDSILRARMVLCVLYSLWPVHDPKVRRAVLLRGMIVLGTRQGGSPPGGRRPQERHEEQCAIERTKPVRPPRRTRLLKIVLIRQNTEKDGFTGKVFISVHTKDARPEMRLSLS